MKKKGKEHCWCLREINCQRVDLKLHTEVAAIELFHGIFFLELYSMTRAKQVEFLW